MEVLNKILPSEYISLKKMLGSTSEDQSICVENIKNLNLDPIYIVFLAKTGCSLNYREEFLSNFKDIFEEEPWASTKKVIRSRWSNDSTVFDFSWEMIHSIIKKHYSNDSFVIKLFTTEFNNQVSNEIIANTTWKFVSKVNCEIIW